MSEPWPPPAPKIKKEFENAKTDSKDKAQDKEHHEMITKEVLENLDKLRKKPIPSLEHTPPGMPKKAVNDELEQRYQKLQKRFQDSSAKSREKFNDVAQDQKKGKERER